MNDKLSILVRMNLDCSQARVAALGHVTLQMFFTDRLAQQRQVSPRTIAAYRDALKLLFEFIHARTGKLPSQLDWNDLDATMISAFLNHLEDERHNSARTNVRTSTRPDSMSSCPKPSPPRPWTGSSTTPTYAQPAANPSGSCKPKTGKEPAP